MGTLTLRRCAAKPLTFCGRLAVPLDYSSAASPGSRSGFRWLPATGAAAGTVLAVEGGPRVRLHRLRTASTGRCSARC